MRNGETERKREKREGKPERKTKKREREKARKRKKRKRERDSREKEREGEKDGKQDRSTERHQKPAWVDIVATNITTATVPKPGVPSSRPAFEEKEGKEREKQKKR